MLTQDRVVHARTGNVIVWMNQGIKPFLSSSMSWDEYSDIWMPGMERGANVHFPRLSKSQRADYHVVDPRTAAAQTWFNQGECVGARDDGSVQDPGLPKVPGSI
jgi:hypothetical protein